MKTKKVLPKVLKPSHTNAPLRGPRKGIIAKSVVIHEYESRRNNDEIAQHYGINRTLLIKWAKDKIKIGSAAESEIRKHLKVRTARKYKELCAELLKVFKEARKKGHRIALTQIRVCSKVKGVACYNQRTISANWVW